ncbi:MAG: hypothetical protein ACOVSW_15510, partial [Candidatus Kapaibacteriota bacterium]
NGNAIQLSKNCLQNTKKYGNQQPLAPMTIALYRATPCAQSSPECDRSGCNRGAFIPRLKRVGFPALIIVKGIN